MKKPGLVMIAAIVCAAVLVSVFGSHRGRREIVIHNSLRTELSPAKDSSTVIIGAEPRVNEKQEFQPPAGSVETTNATFGK